MADVHTKEQRSYNMSRIKGKDTKPEMLVRKFLHAIKWNVSPNTKTIEKYFQNLHITPYKYHASYVYEVYDTFNDLDWIKVESDLDNLINRYKQLVS